MTKEVVSSLERHVDVARFIVENRPGGQWSDTIREAFEDDTFIGMLGRAGFGRGEVVSKEEYAAVAEEIIFAVMWVKFGRQVYEVSHSLAAMLSVTKAPPLAFDRLPHPAMLIVVPSEYIPMPYASRPRSMRCIGVFGIPSGEDAGKGVLLAIPDGEQFPNVLSVGVSARRAEEGSIPNGNANGLQVALRLASNVSEYVSQYRECVSIASNRPSVLGGEPVIHKMGAPRDVVVDAAFRRHAAALVSSTDFKGMKRALSHFVRGHWRNQRVGEGRAERRMTWVRPFRRGDESLGSVVQKTTRIEVAS